MSTLDRVTKAIANVNPPRLIGADLGTSSNDMWLFNQSGIDYKFSYSGHASAVKAYQQCAPLTAIINKRAEAINYGNVEFINVSGKEKDKMATGPIVDRIRQLMKAPNPFQTWQQFEAQLSVYLDVFGFCIMLPIVPDGFDNTRAKAIYNIPPSMVDIEETEKLFYTAEPDEMIKRVVLRYRNTTTILEAKGLWIMKGKVPSFDSFVLPDSKIKSLEMEINNIIGAYESRNVLINYRGSLGILTPETISGIGVGAVNPEHKQQLQNDFLKYGLKNSQWKFIISQAALKWQSMGIPTKDLMLFEEIEDDIMRICDSYNYPYPLMSSNRTNSLGGNNIGESQKLLFTNAIIPEAGNIYQQLTTFLGLDKYGIEMRKSFKHVEALQEDKEKQSRARRELNEALKIEWEMGLITMNQWLEKLGEQPLSDAIGNLRRTEMPSNSQPLAVTIGVGGVQGLISVLTAQGMSQQARQSTLEIVFGLSPQDAARMSTASENQSQQTQSQGNQGQNNQQNNQAA